MPTNSERTLSPTDRRRQIASILAKGVIRWLKHEKTAGIMNAQKTSPGRKNRLELSEETSLTVGNDRCFTAVSTGERRVSPRLKQPQPNPGQ